MISIPTDDSALKSGKGYNSKRQGRDADTIKCE